MTILLQVKYYAPNIPPEIKPITMDQLSTIHHCVADSQDSLASTSQEQIRWKIFPIIRKHIIQEYLEYQELFYMGQLKGHKDKYQK